MSDISKRLLSFFVHNLIKRYFCYSVVKHGNRERDLIYGIPFIIYVAQMMAKTFLS